MKPLYFIFSLLLAFSSSLNAANDLESPAQVVQTGVTNVLVMLDNPDISLQDRRQKLHAIIATRFDFNEMSFRIMAQHWQKFNEEQKQQFEAGLINMLENIYFKAINDYSSEIVRVGGERMKGPNNATVIVTIVRNNGSDIPLLFKMHRKDDSPWLAYDANVEGISLVSHYRDRFAKIMAKDGIDGVLTFLGKQANS